MCEPPGSWMMNEDSTVLLLKVMCVVMVIYAMAAVMSCFPKLEWALGKNGKRRNRALEGGHSSDESPPSQPA